VDRLGLRQEAFTLGALAGQLACAAHGLGLPTRLGLGRLLESSAGLHFPEDALALHLLLQGLERLIDVVVADHDLNDLKLSIGFPAGPGSELAVECRNAETNRTAPFGGCVSPPDG